MAQRRATGATCRQQPTRGTPHTRSHMQHTRPRTGGVPLALGGHEVLPRAHQRHLLHVPELQHAVQAVLHGRHSMVRLDSRQSMVKLGARSSLSEWL